MKHKYHIAIDIGSGSSRMFVGWLQNGKLRLEELHRFETGDVPLLGKHVRNVYRWYDEIIRGLKKFSQKYGSHLSSIGADSMGEDIVILDKHGEVLFMPLAYRDVVASSEVLLAEEERMGNHEIYMRCGNQSVQNDTLRQLITLRLQPDNPLKDAGGMLFFGDLFHYLLCGRAVTEASLANYGKLYNQHTGGWDDEIFTAFDLPECLKMDIVFCGECLGKVDQMICRDTGLNEDAVVIASSNHDSACAAFAVPDLGNDWGFISSGSWSIIGIETDAPVICEEGWRFNFANSYMPMRKNMFKRLVAGMWMIQRCQKEWGSYSFSELVDMAADIHDNTCYVNPDDERLYNPESMCESISKLVAIDYNVQVDPMDAARISRIIFESLALKYRYIIHKLRSMAEHPINKLYILGGGSHNTLLNQLTSNACEMPVYTGIYEASVIGNLMTQFIGSGELADAVDARKMLIESFPLSCFQPKDSELWARKFEDFVRVLGKDYP